MNWFSKEKGDENSFKEESLLPELPDYKEELDFSQKIPDEMKKLPKIEIDELSPISEPETKKEIYQREIKSAINSNNDFKNEMQKSRFESEPTIRSIDDSSLQSISKEKPIHLKQKTTPGFFKPSTKDLKSIYVKLDKFNEAIETFEEIRDKVIEIEQLLKRTKEIKMKEEQELEAWEREIQIIKSRIDEIDKDLFGKFD